MTDRTPKTPRKLPPSPFKDGGITTVLVVVIGMLFGILAPASAQFFNFGFEAPRRPQRAAPPPNNGGFFSPFENFFPDQPRAPPRPVDYSRAPPAPKQDVVPERSVLVLGDAMADWLAYGLEDALSEQPDLGVLRRHKTVSGLIRYQPKGEPGDWAAAAKGILAKEKPDVIVVMLGLHDRVPIREPEKKADDKKKDAKAKPETGKTDGAKPDTQPPDSVTAAKPTEKAEPETNADDEQPQIITNERGGRGGALIDFREDRWNELYAKKIDEMIGVLKSKGVPVLWVGLPALRGPKGTSDMLYLDALYRDAAGRAGITYVDVWDGFVDDGGRFMQQGPDFEGQIRRLRTPDGVFFTKPGARKLAHYTDREIQRVLANRTSPLALPSEPLAPELTPRPGTPTPRPLAGPILPLVAASIRSDELLGGAGSRPAAVDALVARTLVKGEPLITVAGRADDFNWPRREVGRLEPGVTPPTPVAAKPDSVPATTTASAADGTLQNVPPKPKKPRVQQSQNNNGFFSFQPSAPQQRQRAYAPPPGFFRW